MYELYFQTMRQNNFKNILHIQNQKYNLTNVTNCIILIINKIYVYTLSP